MGYSLPIATVQMDGKAEAGIEARSQDIGLAVLVVIGRVFTQ